MEDDQTQPLTQRVMDPRRMGRNNSGLNEDDVADVLAILHPASASSIKIVEDAAKHRPEHVLFHSFDDSFSDEDVNIEEQETIIIDKHHDARPQGHTGNDLVLRMSSKLRTPSLGFVFGRNAHSTDVVFGQDSGKRISNQHFRIYMNQDSILMVEDMSTNGTLVDEVLLKNKDPRFSNVRMLSSGSIICINSGSEAEMIKFIVRVPSRASHLEQFERNLQDFFKRCIQDEAKLKATLQRLDKRKFGGASMKWDGGDKYNFIGSLGKGAFATVYQIATKMDGKILAAKELEKRRFMKNGQLDRKIDNEMKIMQDLAHPNVVEFVEYHDQGDFLYIIMEFVRHGDLQGYLNQHGSLSEADAQRMAKQLLSALAHLHKMKITHRDIKPDNILIASLDPIHVKLSDFGLSKVVKTDETFLKTFCGTLLYCAPEVFPDFDGALSKGTKRRRGAKQTYHSYSSSVDIWSFAAVLWFSLCGMPPFEGIADATGQAMYNNIMATDLDPTPLRNANVSETCIDLLCKMLQKDPSQRPTEFQCLRHPWLNDGSFVGDDPSLQSIVEEDESEAHEQFSQLSINEEDFVPASDEEANVLEDDEFGGLMNPRQSKKIRVDPLYPRNQVRDNEDLSSADPSFHTEEPFESRIEFEESFRAMAPQPNRPRLFGEIGASALESSGVLSAHMTEALTNEDSSGEAPRPQAPLAKSEQGRRTPPIPRPQLDGTYSSPSLLGAESLVREMNMASPQSQDSGPHSQNEPETPKTPDVPQHNSLESPSQRPSQLSDSTPKAKPSTFNRQIVLPKTASFYYDPYDSSTHNLEFASRESGVDFVAAASADQKSEPEIGDTMPQLNASVSNETTQGMEHGATSEPQMPEIEVVPLPSALEIKAPPRRLGKLIATADSFVPSLTLMIDQSRTSWGRGPGNTIVYEDGSDTRIPKTAFVIFWWTEQGDMSTVEQLSQQGKDWTSLPGLHCCILTCARFGISVNGKHLRQKDDKDRALYGDLHNGDIIQVYQAGRGAECLKFKAEIYLGSGKEPRPPNEAFKVLVGSKLPSS
ncbi:Pkinase-domain-containing protein [Polyplosphaeria fusca]|uniref:Pkinase-domain-containing protein n=1 Tax=Polyplosphaeria fusca TaxID=682080 RepID=A0A9P4QI77_9PLEO|nr:Pkinase-domain-containing protein [Polyplosphaeria fusca]